MRYILLIFLMVFTLGCASDDPYLFFERYNTLKQTLYETDWKINRVIEQQKEVEKDIENLKYVKKVMEEVAENYKK
ncbi:MAG: hypothetical protein NC905_04870 [Candidatus Omnitrophica bacterium]|nr:hypothetical protein [Candidatus Omnitrophota bacterium]